MTHPGVYCLRSSQTDWDEETLWRTYATLTDIEAVFRSLKSELGLRPIFHHKPIRAEGHLFITVSEASCAVAAATVFAWSTPAERLLFP